MNDVKFRSDFDVDLVESMGSDEVICKAARVSTLGAASLDTTESTGLINFLMSKRHGSPFEHNSMMFRITQPKAMWSEFMRHRIGFSYNEESARYKKIDGVFYIPPPERNLIQVGKPGAYDFIPGTLNQYNIVRDGLEGSYVVAWETYNNLIDEDTAKEIARFCLPVSVYTTAYVTCNARSLMSFLSLRTKWYGSKFESFPQWEINQVANQMEEIFKELFPITHAKFCENGRVSP